VDVDDIDFKLLAVNEIIKSDLFNDLVRSFRPSSTPILYSTGISDSGVLPVGKPSLLCSCFSREWADSQGMPA
jgi:hypothetical protein